MFKNEIIEFGNLFCQKYTFPKRGDGIPLHEHKEIKEQHLTIVQQGSCICYGENKNWEIILKQGDIYDFPNDKQKHEIIALEDNTIIMTINKYDKPWNYEFITDEDRQGIIERNTIYRLDDND